MKTESYDKNLLDTRCKEDIDVPFTIDTTIAWV